MKGITFVNHCCVNTRFRLRYELLKYIRESIEHIRQRDPNKESDKMQGAAFAYRQIAKLIKKIT